jgi:hypothetical protein
MDKDPPALPGSAPKSKPEAASKEAQAALQQRAAQAAKEKSSDEEDREDCPQPPPFDMLDLPEGMQAMGFKNAAYLAKRWFNGKAHTIPDKSDAVLDAEFVDTDTFKLSWILRFGNVRERYQHLLKNNPKLKENIYNSGAQRQLQKALKRFVDENGFYYADTMDTLAACYNDKQSLHRQFQFQYVAVSMPDVLGGYTTVMNDLSASLANFAIYAAPAKVEFFTQQYHRYDHYPWLRCVRTQAKVTHIYVYVMDRYSFNDKTAISQYLGHWNRSGVIIGVDAAASEQASKVWDRLAHESGNAPKQYLPPLPEHLAKPVDTGSKLRKAEVFYPVRNRDFQQWRNLKGRGGDLMVFSDFERIKLPEPIELDLGETSWEYKQ